MHMHMQCTDLGRAELVEQDVGRLEVEMQHLSRGGQGVRGVTGVGGDSGVSKGSAGVSRGR